MSQEIAKQEVKKPVNVMDEMAGMWKIEKEQLKRILIHTVIKPIKTKDGKLRNVTEEELYAFVLVCKEYGLNPLLKEIYAYPDTKSGSIIPVVGIDGWIKLGTRHPEYRSHKFTYPEGEMVKPSAKAKACYPWMECTVERYVLDESGKRVTRTVTFPDGSSTSAYEVVETTHREYLDECFNGGKNYANPWDTHTKRFLGWKTLIQTFREAFGFSGIKDEDEAKRIIEDKEDDAKDNNFMPQVAQQQDVIDVQPAVQQHNVETEDMIPEQQIDDIKEPVDDIKEPVEKEVKKKGTKMSKIVELKKLMKIMFGDDLLTIGKKIQSYSGRMSFDELTDAEAGAIIEGVTHEAATITKDNVEG